MANLKDLRFITDIHIVKHVMFDYDYRNVRVVNARFEIMMKLWKLLVENGAGDVSFAL
jgi:hypothetical protein